MPIFYNERPPNAAPAESRPYSAVRPITASAARVTPTSKKDSEELRNRKSTQQWQTEAWYNYDHIGEIAYAFELFANVISRVKIYAGYVEDEHDTPTPIKASNASEEAKKATEKATNQLFGGGRQGKIIKKAATNMLVTGECYLINEEVRDNGYPQTRWRIISTDELLPLNNGFAYRPRESADKTAKPLPPSTFIGRMWREHARFSDEPFSSMKALCPLCEKFLLIGRVVDSTAQSRLNAGALFVPDTFSVTREVASDTISEDVDEYLEDEQDEFEEELIESMMTPISDEGSASAIVPLLIRGPEDAGEKIKLIKFERAFDAALANREDRYLERILGGLDLPKELVSGLANVKYNNATVIDQMFYTAHIEPMVLMLCDIFRSVYLERYLYLAGIDPEEIEKIVFWYDPSGITTAPDRSSAANVGADKLFLSADAWRSANGFNEDDAPSEDELIMRLALQRGVLTPEMTDTIFAKYWPEIMEATRARTQAGQAAPIPEDVEQILDPDTTAAPPPVDTSGEAPSPEGPNPDPQPPEGLLEP